MSVAAWAQSHRRSILFLLLMLAMAGMVAALHLPVSLFPTIPFPRAVVSLDAGDQPAEQMEMLVTRPVEEAVRRVPGVRNLRSTTSRGSAEVSINFDWGRDMAGATLEVNAAIAQVLGQLPAGTQMTTRRMDPTVFPIIAYSLVSSTLSPVQLRDLAEYQLRPLLSSVNGVSSVQTMGGALEEYRVTVDPVRLRAHDLTLDEVARTLAAANVLSAVGRLEDHYKLYLVMSDTRLQSLAQIRQTVLRNAAGAMVRLADVGTVEQAVVPEWTRVTADGRDAVLFSVYQQPGSNSVQIAADVKAKLAEYRRNIPAGVRIASWYDQSELVTESAASVRDAVLIGIGLSALVLLVFLRNVKVTMIAVVVVPAVLASTVLLLSVLGMSFNIMTLGGMAAAVGLIIDDAIVMIEHIVRRLQGGRGEMHERVISAAIEFTRPLAGSSASTLVIFAPLAFLSGVTGAFFKALSLTMAAALFISFLLTWLAVPLLAERFLKARDAEPHPESRLLLWLQRHYRRTLTALFRRPLLALPAVAALVMIGILAFRAVGSGFMPAMDEGGFVLDYRSQPGTALSETDRLLRQVEQIVRDTPDVDSYSRRTGTGLGGGLSEANSGDFFIRLKAGNRRPVEAVMDDIRGRVERDVPGLTIEMAQLMEDLIGDLTAVPQPVEIKIFADTPEQLNRAAQKVAARIAKINGVVDVRNGINPAGDALLIHIDPAKAAQEGTDVDAVSKSVDAMLNGVVATRVAVGAKMVGLRLWIPKALRGTDTALLQLQLRAPDGHLFPLQRVATMQAVTGQPQIARENLKRMVAVTARISGRDLGSVIADVKQAMAQPDALPAGAYFTLGGLYEQQQIAFQGLLMVFAAAAALVFLLLLFMYESFRIALSILVTALLAVSAVFAGLWISRTELNISAMMGMTMIIGMATEVAIFYYSEQRDLLRTMPMEQALVEAGINRMRPIAMTTLAAILTLLPLAFAIGKGSEMQQPLAIAIISGLVVQLPLVLLLMPVLAYVTRNRNGA
ncbi:efflux RND transporter permease subunit [Duganella sp. BJB488]|uniref:efflux RND transporter permease subunit n=1 Tax=unclassified Duganella TaxID=2636909 RepID=UPI000E34A4EB|nr:MULTISPECIES: efflux RND transporter permease subunit [unclassified Duganella]RFP21852.1 efflux RND transporter permease subunit [Duganella sp. BJB489]RFP23646.1 efflux RND transporter permease subunit [Duganella sp. BJB488]RFP38812.1 efflux RND transporter permease subunit [Duganella sp. BJB480]